MFRTLTLFWLLSGWQFFCQSGYSQETATITGRVFDNQTKEPLPGATVLYKRDAGTITNSEGFFSFTAPAGSLSITFQYLGYQTISRQMSLSPGEVLSIDIGLDVLVAQIEQVVVSAGRVEQRLADLTVSMSVVKPSAISGIHITDAQELMNKSSGIEVLDGQASIRGGSGFSYGAGSRVMLLVDGLPMLSADAGHVKWHTLPMENISQVEIIKGAASVMYGSSALNGIINFRTAEATSLGKTSFYAESGIFDQPRQSKWVWWDSPRMFSNVSLAHQKKYGNTDVIIGSFAQVDNGYRRLNDNRMGRINLGVKQNSRNISGLSYGLGMKGVMNRGRDFILWENAETGALKQDESTAQELHGFTFTLDPSISLLGKNHFSHEFKSRYQLTNNTFPDGGQNNSDARSIYNEYVLRFVPKELLNVHAGLVHYQTWIRSNFYGDHNGRNLAGFAQADVYLFDRFNLTAGMRMEHNTLDGVNDKIIPLFRAGVNYRVLDLTFLRASFGQGYRYPSVAEKFAATTLGAVKIIPNPQIMPESGWNTELGVKQGVTTNYFEGIFDLALFYSQNKDMIEFVFGIYPDPGTGVYNLGFMATNVEYSRVYGFELEYLLILNPGRVNTTVNGGYVFMYPVEFNQFTGKNTGNYLKFRRKHAFNMNVVSEYRRFGFGIHAYVKSSILNIDAVFLSPSTREDILPGFFNYWIDNNNGYFLMDASLSYKLSPRYKLSLAIKNLTNTEYMGRPGDIQPHRHVSLRVTGEL